MLNLVRVFLIFSLYILANISFAGDYNSADDFQYTPHHFHQQQRVIYRYRNHRRVTNNYYRYTALVHPGSLRNNVKRIANNFGWHYVKWDVPYDFTFVGAVRIRANSIEGIMAKLLQNYPLQAVFYRGNGVVLIKSRALA